MNRRPIFALVDCDNFFVSCERVFRPDLWRQPVAVLSNNDGCVVARSNEVKALGVPMAVPYFKVRDVLQAHKVEVFSGNFALYGDFSQRVVGLLQAAAPRVEVYSVDESFLEISSLPISDYEAWARSLRAQIWQWLGIPVSIGVASTKTLAKAAAEHAKHTPALAGAYSLLPDNLLTPQEAELRCVSLLKSMPIGGVWGVGWRTAPRLRDRGLSSAYDLSLVSTAWARQQLTVRGEGTVRELNGESRFAIEDDNKPQQSLIVTRTFEKRVRSLHDLEGRIAGFAARAAQKLRRHNQVAEAVGVFIAGDRHRDGENYRRVHAMQHILQPSNTTGTLIAAALQALLKIYDSDYSYRRAGVAMYELKDAAQQQLSWLSPDTPAELTRQKALMGAIDKLNEKYHSSLIWHAAEQAGRAPHERLHRSPAYTTQWDSLPKVQ